MPGCIHIHSFVDAIAGSIEQKTHFAPGGNPAHAATVQAGDFTDPT
jgi:hypothetical protein